MRTTIAALSALSGLAFILGSFARANPVPDPVYTFCETEDNDLCSNPQILDSNLAAASVGGGAEGEFVRDCFYLTGKLQEDCVWDIEPKCAMKVYDKPAPCRTTSGAPIPGNFYEPILRSSNGEDLINVVPLSDHTIRLGVAALQDAFDGTINGLAGNGAHNETGEVTVKIFYHTGGDGQPRGDQPDQSYVFHFGGPRDRGLTPFVPMDGLLSDTWVCEPAVGSDAARVAFIIPVNVSSVDIVCCNNTGVEGVCYDVDHYKVTHLIPGRFYGIEVIGGLDDADNPLGCGECGVPTNTKLGWFDKNCNLIGMDDNSGQSPYSKIFATAESDGSLRFAVSGGATHEETEFSMEGGDFSDTGNNDSGALVRKFYVDEEGTVDGLCICFSDFRHTFVGDIIATLIHEDDSDPGNPVLTKIKFINNVGNPIPDGATGYGSKLYGDYCFSSNPADPGFEEAAGAAAPSFSFRGSPDVIPSGTYRADDLGAPNSNTLAAFLGQNRRGSWTVILEDTYSDADPGSAESIQLVFKKSIPGDCDFNGLRDDIQQDYFDLLDRLRIVDGLNYDYRQGASTKDASAGDVNRYPRPIWDWPNNQNLHGEGFLANYGGAPEAYFAHGVCGGYCVKIQLAEHVDPNDRPAAPAVMNSSRADINSDGLVNASDLALLLSYWGVVH